MQRWMRFEHAGAIHVGTLDASGALKIHGGNLFEGPRPTGETVMLSDVRVLAPVIPSKFIGLWNNFHALAEKQGTPPPEEPLYFFKAPSSIIGHEEPIRRPPGYDGRVVYEGELGIVIGRRVRNADEAQAEAAIFGYTCVNDVTAQDVLMRDPAFTQWARAKSFDTFGSVGPVIATGLDPGTLTVRTSVNDRERQNYPVADMIFSPRALVSRISRELTLEPGDLIACGTSLGAGVLRPGSTVAVSIDGIGELKNTLE